TGLQMAADKGKVIKSIFIDPVARTSEYYYNKYLWLWQNEDIGTDYNEGLTTNNYSGLRRLNEFTPFKPILKLLSARNREVITEFYKLAKNYEIKADDDNNYTFYYTLANQILCSKKPRQEERRVNLAMSMISDAIIELNSIQLTEEFKTYVMQEAAKSTKVDHHKTILIKREIFKDDWQNIGMTLIVSEY
ncbi:MAG: hypothetical protein Q8T08_25040, partial [Ignavibacteria bacterium]|nr:hypothetical protein [Ignavibacteria bacterium]